MEQEESKKSKPFRKVLINKVEPNNWNPNVMDPKLYNKLVKGIKRTMKSGDMPPIVVRRGVNKKYEIIDGYHRWKAFREIGETHIPVFILDVDDATARILTNTLNYLRGEPDEDKYARNIAEILELSDTTLDDLATLLPESVMQLEVLMEESDVVMEAYTQLVPDDESPLDTNLLGEDDVWVDLKFRVSLSAARMIESEIQRISTAIRGRNVRSRCLEMMAAQSSGTPLPHDVH